jgi:hypothetical protein
MKEYSRVTIPPDGPKEATSEPTDCFQEKLEARQSIDGRSSWTCYTT